ILSTVSIALLAAPLALGHSWIEQLVNINDDGKYVGAFGYPRGFVQRTDPEFNGESDKYMLPPIEQQPPYINSSNLLCHPAQRTQKQAGNYPRLQATPGGFMAMRYYENGHVTFPRDDNTNLGKPEHAGTIFIYGTTKPKDDEKIFDILQWNQDGSGGDKRGKLLAMNDYDDGRCFQVNAMPKSAERQKQTPNYAQGQLDGPGNFELMCETNVALPKDAATGKPYTIYWVWQWPTLPGIDPNIPKGKDEYYTTCIDVDVVDTIKQDSDSGGKRKYALVQQDAMSVAVDDFKSRTALMTDVVKGEMGPIFSGDATPTGGAPPSTGTPSAPPTLQTSVVGSPNTAVPGSPTKPGNSNIPTLTKRPGGPSHRPSQRPNTDGDAVTVTVTERVTVTAPAVIQTLTACAKFRGRY
ncbi:hypothetical protein K469DRAFT_479509, partial [Zopfia rhizophila CBS 207.26]